MSYIIDWGRYSDMALIHFRVYDHPTKDWVKPVSLILGGGSFGAIILGITSFNSGTPEETFLFIAGGILGLCARYAFHNWVRQDIKEENLVRIKEKAEELAKEYQQKLANGEITYEEYNQVIAQITTDIQKYECSSL